MLTSAQLVEFKKLFDNNEISDIGSVIWSTLQLNYNEFPTKDHSIDTGDFLFIPDITFETYINMFNVLLYMLDCAFPITDTSDGTIKKFLYEYIIKAEDNYIIDCIKEVLKKEWDFILDQGERELTDRINSLTLEDVVITIYGLDIKIQGFVKV